MNGRQEFPEADTLLWRQGIRLADDGQMRAYRYHRIDVFTDRAFGGNPLAVFPVATRLDAQQMQAIAREMNLSETVFVLPPQKAGAAARLRIFTIDRELPLAGHPVVGAAFALAQTGVVETRQGRNEITLELGAGPLPVEIDMKDGKVQSVFMTQKPPKFGAEMRDARAIAAALSLPPESIDLEMMAPRVVDTGIPWFCVPVKDMRALAAVRADHARCDEIARQVGTDLWHAFTLDTGDPDCAVRTRHVWWGRVTPGEDPVTGSAIGCIASYLVGEGVLLAAPEAVMQVEQGQEVGRPGKVTARISASQGVVRRVQVGGSAVHVGNGEIWIADS